jgi:hypothetical protein
MKRNYSIFTFFLYTTLESFILPLLPIYSGLGSNRIPVWVSFIALDQTGPEAHSASYTMGTVHFLGESGLGVALITHPHLEPRLKKERSYTPTSPLGLRCLF